MMKRRKVIAFLVLALGASFSYYILSSPSSPKAAEQANIAAVTGADDARFKFLQGSGNNAGSVNSSSSTAATSDNLTDRFASLYTSQIVKANPDRTEVKKNGSLAIPSQDIFDSLLKQSLEEELSSPRYSAKDILTNKIDSKETRAAYLASVKTLVAAHASLFRAEADALGAFFENDNREPLRTYVGKLERQIGELLSMSVPSSLQPIHLDLLSALARKDLVYSSVLGVESDPIKTLLAIKEVTTVTERLSIIRERIEASMKANAS